MKLSEDLIVGVLKIQNSLEKLIVFLELSWESS